MTTPESNRWFLAETNELIAIWGDESVQKMFDGTVRDAEVYKLISNRLAGKGYSRSVNQVKTKIKSLKREFRKTLLDINSNNSGGKIKFNHFDKLNKIMGVGKPLFTAESILPNDYFNSSENTATVEGTDYTPSQSELENTFRLDNIKVEEVEEESQTPPTENTNLRINGMWTDKSVMSDSSYSEPCGSTEQTNVRLGINPESQNGVKDLKDPDQSTVKKNVKSSEGKSTQKQKKVSIRECIKTTISTTVDKFLSLEKEIEERNFQQNKKFQEQLLQLEREKINLLKLYINK